MAGERRSRFRGNKAYDLCNLLEAYRRRAGLSAVALADQTGLVVAGAGSYRQCEELGARASVERIGEEIVVSQQTLRLCFSSAGDTGRPASVGRQAVHGACERILEGRPRKLPDGLLR